MPGITTAGVLLTLADGRVTVRLTRDLWKLESSHIELARSGSAIAREHGAVPDRAAVQKVQLAIAARQDAIDVGFWRAVLGYAPMADDNAGDPLGHGSTVWMHVVDDSHAPSRWILSDRAGNRVCICAWPDGFTANRYGVPRLLP